MNRFAIAEDDQFEMHVKDYPDKSSIKEEDYYKAAEEVILKAQQGRVINYSLLVLIDYDL